MLSRGIVRTHTGEYLRVPLTDIQHWRDPEPPQIAPQAPALEQDPEEGVRFSDYAKSIMSGGAQVAEGVGWLTRMAGFEDVGRSIEELGSNAVDYWNSGLSDAAKDALSREFVRKNEGGEWEWGDANLNTVGLLGAQSLMGTAAGAGVGAGITKVLQVFANPVGRSALTQAVDKGLKAVPAARAGDAAAQTAVRTAQAAAKKLQIVDKVIGASGFGLGEGAIGGITAGLNVYKSVMSLPPEKLASNDRYQQVFNSTDEAMPYLERHQYAAETVAREASSLTGFQAGLTTALLGAPMGAFFGSILGKKALGAMASSTPRAMLTGAGGEAAQEFAQGGAEQLIANRQRAIAGEDIELFEGVLNQAIGGAVAGAPLGAAFGSMDVQPHSRTGQSEPKRAKTGPRLDPLRTVATDAFKAGVPQEEILQTVERVKKGEEPVLVAVGKLRKRQMGFAGAQPAEGAASTAEDKRESDHAAAAPADFNEAAVDAGATIAKPQRALPDAAIGAETTVTGEKPLRAQFQLVDVNTLVTSHDAEGRANAAFPAELQPRDRSRTASRQWIEETTAKFQHEPMIEGVEAGSGPPIVDSDGIVESGNGRVNLLRNVYTNGKGRGAAYKAYLKAHAARFGIDPAAIEKMKTPILVRVRQDAMSIDERIAFTQSANRPTVASISPAERARADAQTLNDAQLNKLNVPDDGNVLAAQNGAFVSSFLQSMPATERGGLLTAEGEPTKQVADRIKAALFAKAYDDDRLLALMAEEADPDVANVVNALVKAAPAFAKVGDAGFDLIGPLMEGVETLRAARKAGQPVEEYLRQQGLFSNISPEAGRVASFLGKNIRSAKRMGEALVEIAKYAEAASNPTGDLLSDPLQKTLAAALDASNKRMTERYPEKTTQGALFSRSGLAPTEVNEPLDALYEKERRLKAIFDVWMDAVAEEVGSPHQPIKVPLKDRARAIEKVQADYAGDVSRLKDVLRGTVIVDSPDQARAVLESARIEYDVNSVRDTLRPDAQTPDGYRDIKFVIRIGGAPQEVQVNLPEMLDAKEKLHRLYAERDSILRGSTFTPKQTARVAELDAQMRVGYDAAWAAALSRLNASSETDVPLRYAESAGKGRPPATSSATQEVPPSDVGRMATGTPSTSKNITSFPNTDTAIPPGESVPEPSTGDGAILYRTAESVTAAIADDETTYQVREAARAPRSRRTAGAGNVPAGAPVQVELFTPGGEPVAQPTDFARRFPPQLKNRIKLVDVGTFKSGIGRVRNWQDAAHIIAPIRKSPQENMVALVVDQASRPIAIIRHTLGTIDAAAVEVWSLGGAIAAVPGAARVYFAHNHPSGGAAQSQADRHITSLLGNVLEGSGIHPEGMIVVVPGSRNASWLELIPTTSSYRGALGLETIGPVTTAARRAGVPIKTRVLRKVTFAGREIEEPHEALSVVKESGLQSGALLLNVRHQIVGSLPMTSSEMKKLRSGDVNLGAARVLKTLHEAGANSAIVVSRDSEAARNLESLFYASSVRVLDSVDPDASRTRGQANQMGNASRHFLSRQAPARGQTAEAVRTSLAKPIAEISQYVDIEVVDSLSVFDVSPEAAGAEGFFLPDSQRVVLVANNIPPGREYEVFTHEVFGHLAMERTPFGKEAVDMVLGLHDKQHASIEPLWGEVAVRWGRLDRETHAKEVIAVMAERGDKHALMTRLIAGVRRFLRKLGIVRDYSEAEIRDLIARSARALRIDVNKALAGKSQKLATLNPSSSDADIVAAIDEAIPEDVVALDAHLQPALFSRAAPADPAIQALIDSKLAKAPEEFTLKDKVRNIWSGIANTQALAVKQGMIDSFASIEALERDFTGGALLDASQSAYKAMLATKNLPSVMAAVMMHGVPNLVGGAYVLVAGRKGVIDIFKPLTEHRDGNLLRQWELFAAANRANRLINERNPDGTRREKLFTQDEIDTALTLEQKYPEFRTVLNEWNAFNKQLLDMAEAAGVVDPIARATWEKNDYVPFYRAVDEFQGPRNKKGVAGQSAGIRTLKGRAEALGNVFENMMMNAAHLVDASFKNRAMQRVVGLGIGTALQPVPFEAEAIKVTDDQLARALTKAGLIVGNPVTGLGGLPVVQGMTAAQKAHWSTIFRRVAPSGQNIVSVQVNGKPEYYEVVDPLVLAAISGAGYGVENLGHIWELFKGSKKLLTSAITAHPAFMLANFIRDTLSTWVVSDASMHPFVDAIKGAKAALTNDPALIQMMMSGAGGGGYYDSSPEDVRKLTSSKVPAGNASGFVQSILTPKNAWQAWRKIGSAGENANRIAVFKAVLAAGGTVAEAAYQARDVLNFSMSGDYVAMRRIVESVPFINARIQGLYRLYRGARDNTQAFVIKGFVLLAATMALALRNNDREEYEDLEEWDKDTYWHLFLNARGEPVGSYDHIRIPKPFEVGAMFATVPERIWRAASGRDSAKILWGQILQMAADTFAFNPVPQLVKPIAEQYANRVMFFNRPIVGMAEQRLEPEAQFTPWTSETMRALAQALPDWAPQWLRSPVRLEAALKAYTGSMGALILDGADAMVRGALGYPESPGRKIYDYPVVSRFLRDPNPRATKYADLMYEMLDSANATFSTINRMRREQRFEEAKEMQTANRSKLAVRVRLNRIGTQVRNINAQIRLIQNSRTISAKEKRERIDVLVERKNSITRQVAPYADLF